MFVLQSVSVLIMLANPQIKQNGRILQPQFCIPLKSSNVHVPLYASYLAVTESVLCPDTCISCLQVYIL